MELTDIMLKRRSIREYADNKIDDEKLEKILEAGLLAPTSRNRRPCELIVVQDKETLEKLSHAKQSGSAMLKNCDTAIIVIADTNKADTWIEDSSIALTYMDLMAASLDIGSCWCQIHLRYSSDDISSEEYVRELLSLDNQYRVVGILSLGNISRRLESHSLDELEKDKIRFV